MKRALFVLIIISSCAILGYFSRHEAFAENPVLFQCTTVTCSSIGCCDSGDNKSCCSFVTSAGEFGACASVIPVECKNIINYGDICNGGVKWIATMIAKSYCSTIQEPYVCTGKKTTTPCSGEGLCGWAALQGCPVP